MLKITNLAFVVGLGVCMAQADRAAVTGTIFDRTHSAAPSAHVSVIYPGTGLRRETQTSSVGVFHIGGLPIGECYLEVDAAGFRTLQIKPFVLTVGETRTLAVSLELATVDSKVEVQAVADALATSSISVSSLTSLQQLNELPVNGRNWASLMALASGAVDSANGSNTAVHFFATQNDDTNYRVDGVDATSIRNRNMRLNSRLLIPVRKASIGSRNAARRAGAIPARTAPGVGSTAHVFLPVMQSTPYSRILQNRPSQ